MKYIDEKTIELNADFAARLEAKAVIGTRRCYQCLTCTLGCPALLYMDYAPNQLVRMVQLGMREPVLNSRTIWLCTDCKACSERCPNGIDIPALMDTLREIALADNLSGERNVSGFHNLFMDNIRQWGRQHELFLILRHKLITRDFFSDVGSGIKMMMKGKLNILPARFKEINEVKEIYKRTKTNAG